MKVLQLGKFYPLQGGVEKVMYDLTEGLSSRGIDCDMLCASTDTLGVCGKMVTIDINRHSRLFVVPTWKSAASTKIAPSMITVLRRMCKLYDVVHVHHPDPMAALALFLSGYKGRVLVHWHSDILKQRFLLTFYKPLQNWLLRRADKIIGTTPVYVKESPHLSKFQDKIDYLPIGVDKLSPDPLIVAQIRSRFPGKKIVFSLGRQVEYKGYRYLIESATYLPDDYVVVIGGGGPLKDEHQTLIHTLGLDSKVILLGRVPDAELSSWFGAGDVFVLSSIYKTEAFAIVQIEAMSCGKPIVATRIPGSGVSWVNKDGESGINVEPADAKALAEAVLSLTSNPAVYGEYSRKSELRFETTFTKRSMMDSYMRFINI